MSTKESMTKREFLKLMGGLSLGLIPFIGCYSKQSKNESDTAENLISQDDTKQKEKATYTVSDNDVIMLSRNDTAYTSYNVAFNKRVSFLPKYIAVCFTNIGIQFAIQKAKQENIQIAVKSGGHSFEGFSSNNDGMVINVSKMKKITWNNDGTVTIEPGILLGELHSEVYAKGKLLPAGSCGGVGIAGLTLGGGYGFFSRKYGLTCDSLIDATIITADEKRVKAKEDKDLLWALKGAGNGNFGVVSALTFKVYDCPSLFSTYTFKHNIVDANNFTVILKNWMEVVKQLPREAFAAFVQNGKTLTLLFTNYSSQNIENIIQPFSVNAKSSSSSIKKPLVPALKRFYGRLEPLYFKNASCGYFKSYNDLAAIAKEIYGEVTKAKGIIFQINTLGGAINDDENRLVSAYPHRAFDFLGELQGYYDSPSQEFDILHSFRSIQKLIAENGITAQYCNYPDIEFKNWQQAYYGNNYKALQLLKKKFDAGNVFRYDQSIEL